MARAWILGALVLGLALSAWGGEEDAPGWVQLESRESGAGPVLEIVRKDGTKARLPAAADTGLLAYLPKMGRGSSKTLAIDENGWNRVLLRFDLSDVGELASAHVVLHWSQSEQPISAPLEVGLHRLRKAFQEAGTTYENAPPFDTPADLRFVFDPSRRQPVRVDVTAAVQLELKTKAAFHGWLLVSTKRRPVPADLTTRKTTGGTRKPQAPRGSPAAPGDDADPEWFRVHSRALKDGPVLRVRLSDGTSAEREAQADTMAISYLPEGNWANKEKLSLDRAGRTRLYVRFDVEGLAEVERAELVLTTSAGPLALTRPIEIGIYDLSTDWRENGLKWSDQPTAAAKALTTFDVTSALGRIAVDVSAAVRQAASRPAGERHGWMLRAAAAKDPKPLPTTPVRRAAPTRPGADLLRDVLALVPWEADAAAAVKRAKAEGKLALALVRASYDDAAPNDNEEIFLGTCLAHPAVHGLLRRGFVSTRLWYRGMTYTMARAASDDPLTGLGTSAARTKPLALVVSDGDGRHLGTLQGVGTFAVERVCGFLTACANQAGRSLAVEPAGADELARFQEGVAAFEGRGLPAAQAIWAGLGPDSPWRFLVRAYAAWPERMRMYAAFTSLQPGAFGAQAEPDGRVGSEVRVPAEQRRKLVLRAVDELLQRQHSDGSWRTAQPYDAYWPGVTALAARALEGWRGELGEARQQRIVAARDKALAWLDSWMEKTSPEAANSFGTAYALDLCLDLLAQDPAYREAAQRAATFHARGQAPNGGWGYDRNFALRWRGGFGGWPVTDKGRVHSMNTGLSLLPLARAKAMGLRVDPKVLEKGAACLVAMRDEPAVFTYTHPVPRNFNKLETSIGRACCCEEALLALGKGDAKALERAVVAFLAHRTDLRRAAKVSPGWMPPRAVSSYFYFFAYQHAARAIRALPEEQRKKRLRLLRDDLLACVEPDGTWVDYLGVGKPYGTAAALLILRWAEE